MSRIQRIVVFSICLFMVVPLAFAAGDPYLIACACGDGGGSDDTTPTTTLAPANNTAILDLNGTPGPVDAGHTLLGSRGHLLFQNLTNNETYSLVRPDDSEVAQLTTQGGRISYYNVSLKNKGKWRLYQADEWELLGVVATPVVEFHIVDDPAGIEFGHYVQTSPINLVGIADSVTVCHFEVEDGRARPVPTDPDTVDVPSGGGLVEINLSWSVQHADPSDASEFILRVSDDTHWQVPIAAGAQVVVGETTESGNVTAHVHVEEGDQIQYSAYGLGPDQILLQSCGDFVAVT